MKSSYVLAAALALVLAACGQQHQAPIAHAVTTAAPAPSEPPTPPPATDAKTGIGK